MSMTLQSIDISGDPTSDELTYLPVRLTYADATDLDAASEFLQFKVKSPAGYGRVLAEVETDALTQIRQFIDVRIGDLKVLKGR